MAQVMFGLIIVFVGIITYSVVAFSNAIKEDIKYEKAKLNDKNNKAYN